MLWDTGHRVRHGFDDTPSSVYVDGRCCVSLKVRKVGPGSSAPDAPEPAAPATGSAAPDPAAPALSPGLDRPGLLYQLTTAISKLNLNIASAHVATFGERARDVFYVTDLLGAQINAPTRQAAIKSALIHLLANDESVTQPAT